jgi:hypothetical protein
MKVTWHGAKASADARRGAEEGLRKAAEHLLAKSQELVPVSDRPGGGFLRDSGVVSVEGLRAAVAYTAVSGGKHKHFAERVHERMDMQHPTGQAKFLEQPLNAEAEEIKRLIAREVKSKLK